MAGSPSAGRVLNEEALAFADQIGTTFLLGYLKAYHARCLIELGELEEAEKLSREALGSPNVEAHSKAYALHSLACALNARHPEHVEPAELAIRDAIAHDKALHYRPELARVYLSYARACSETGAKLKKPRNSSTRPQPCSKEWGWNGISLRPNDYGSGEPTERRQCC